MINPRATSEPLTPEERVELEGCYPCTIRGCTRRRELIAKCLAQFDAAIDQTWSVGTRAEEAEQAHHEAVEERKDWEQQHGVQWERAEKAEARVRELEENRDTFLSGHVASLESSLAAATALLVRSIPIMSDDVLREVSAFLAGQPAAPRNPYVCEPDCESPRCPAKVWEREHAQPAAPTRTEAERTPVRSYASEEEWYNDGCPAEAVIRSTP